MREAGCAAAGALGAPRVGLGCARSAFMLSVCRMRRSAAPTAPCVARPKMSSLAEAFSSSSAACRFLQPVHHGQDWGSGQD